MKMKKFIYLFICLFAGVANAGLIYDEAVDGDAAGDNNSGSVIGADLGLLAFGTNSVMGSTPGGDDDDWFKFSIGVGFTLDSITLSAYSGPGGNLGWAGNGLNIDVDHVGPLDGSLIGTDLLESPGLFSVSDSFGPGSYAIKLGTGTNQNSYTIDFNVSRGGVSVPEPTSIALLSFGLAGIGFSRKKRKTT